MYQQLIKNQIKSSRTTEDAIKKQTIYKSQTCFGTKWLQNRPPDLSRPASGTKFDGEPNVHNQKFKKKHPENQRNPKTYYY